MKEYFLNKIEKKALQINSLFYWVFKIKSTIKVAKFSPLFFNKRSFLSLIVAMEVFTFVRYSKTLLNHQKMLKKTSHATLLSGLQNSLQILLLMAGLAFSFSTSYGQGWERHYGTTGDDLGQAIIQTKDLGFLSVGFSNRLVSDKNFDVFVLKTDVDGKELWNRVYNEGLTDHGYDITATSDNGYLIVGDTRFNDQSNSNVLLIKIDEEGRKLWSKQFGGADDDTGYKIIPTVKNGGYLIVGTTTNIASSNSEVLLIKLDVNGNEAWTRTFGTAGKDAGRAVVEVADGYLVTGSAFNSQNNSTDLYLLKVDLAGNKSWDKFYGGSEFDEGHSIVLTNDGAIAIAGQTKAVSDVYLIKVKTSGDVIWIKTFGGTFGDVGFEMVKAANGDFVIAGITEISSSNTDAYILRTDANGNRIWSINTGRSSHVDWAQGLALTHDNGVVAVGYSALFGSLINDLTLIKIGNEGTVSTNRVRGKVFADNNDCVYSFGEKGFPDGLLRLHLQRKLSTQLRILMATMK
jgi:hypothetical protein